MNPGIASILLLISLALGRRAKTLLLQDTNIRENIHRSGLLGDIAIVLKDVAGELDSYPESKHAPPEASHPTVLPGKVAVLNEPCVQVGQWYFLKEGNSVLPFLVQSIDDLVHLICDGLNTEDNHVECTMSYFVSNIKSGKFRLTVAPNPKRN